MPYGCDRHRFSRVVVGRDGRDDAPERAAAPSSSLCDRPICPAARGARAGYLGVWLALAASVWLADRPPEAASSGCTAGRSPPRSSPAAAVYQLTPLKRRCLAICRAPLARILTAGATARPRVPGRRERALVRRLLRRAHRCAARARMMGIGWMIAVGAAIVIEKTTPVGVLASRIAAVALALGAVAWAIELPRARRLLRVVQLRGDLPVPDDRRRARRPFDDGVCFGVLCWRIERGNVESASLDGLNVALVCRYDDDEPGSPWSVLLHLDARATHEQRARCVTSSSRGSRTCRGSARRAT